MTDAATVQAQQAAYWNGQGAEMWVVRQAQMDASLAPVSDATLTEAAAAPGETVLDIGCGTGGTVLALADAVGEAGHVVGLDISEPMLGLARSRAEGRGNVTLILGDAAGYSFAPASADLLFSRFGVMFFGDPVAAFANMRAALRPQGRVAFACWQEAAANPWVSIPTRTLAPFVGPQPPHDPGLPGQFAFGDANRVADILTAAGFAVPHFIPFTFPMPLGRSLDDAVQRTSEFGANGRAFADLSEERKAEARVALREALAPHVNAKGMVLLPGRVWIVKAKPAFMVS